MKINKTILPFTLQGIFLFILSIIILTAGIARADLAALLWSVSFLILSLYGLIFNYISFFLLSGRFKNRNFPVILLLPGSGSFPGEAVNYQLQVDSHPLVMPAFILKAELIFESESGRILNIAHTLKPGKNIIDDCVTPQHRGVYKCVMCKITIRDIPGFTNSSYTVSMDETITVYPVLKAVRDIVLASESTESRDKLKSKKSSDELLEVRKYYFGDDPRRINWKLLAHSDELFIRKGVETPPPQSRTLFILDPSVSPYVPKAIEKDYLDNLIESAASLITARIAKGVEVSLLIPGIEKPLLFNKRTVHSLLTTLAGIKWINEPMAASFPVRVKRIVLLYSSPGSINLPVLIKEVKSRKWDLHLFLKDHTFPLTGSHKPPAWKSWFFLPDPGDQSRLLAGIEKPFKEALLSEINQWKNRPWSINNAGII